MNKHSSPSGRYKLTLSKKPTKPGCWDYAVGEVALSDDLMNAPHSSATTAAIATVNRNYSSFPFLFVENHPNGHDYLICGENYQGQTVIELDTGKRLDFLPPEAEKGHGFCWGSYEFDIASQILIVEGCYWACPYEFKFYNFSDPMNGWAEITPDQWIDSDNAKKPEIDGDTIKVTYEEEGKISSIVTLMRSGNVLIFQDEWVSEEEKDRRQKSEEAHKRNEAEIKLFKETDPLYLKYKELLKEMPKVEGHTGIGVTPKDWCPDFHLTERRFTHTIHKGTIYQIYLEWAIYTGPIKLRIFKNEQSKELITKFFNHSVECMEEAFNYAKEFLD